MIGNSWRQSSFSDLARYLEFGATDTEAERVAWWERRNVAASTMRGAADEMARDARLNDVVRKPVYHLEVSFPPADQPSRDVLVRVADRTLRDLDLGEHQAIIVAHQDKSHPHFHCMVSLVHPWTHRVWKARRDHERIERSLRTQERELGLQEVAGRLHLLPGQTRPSLAVTRRAGELRREQRTGVPSLLSFAREAVPQAMAAATSFVTLEARLRDVGLELRGAGRGLVVGDGRTWVPLSHTAEGVSLRILEERFAQRYAEHLAPGRPARAPGYAHPATGATAGQHSSIERSPAEAADAASDGLDRHLPAAADPGAGAGPGTARTAADDRAGRVRATGTPADSPGAPVDRNDGLRPAVELGVHGAHAGASAAPGVDAGQSADEDRTRDDDGGGVPGVLAPDPASDGIGYGGTGPGRVGPGDADPRRRGGGGQARTRDRSVAQGGGAAGGIDHHRYGHGDQEPGRVARKDEQGAGEAREDALVAPAPADAGRVRALRGGDDPAADATSTGLDPHATPARSPDRRGERHPQLPGGLAGAAGGDAARQPLAPARGGRHDHLGTPAKPMMSIRRSRADARFHVELDAAGATAIRDRLSGELHRAAGVGDAHVDAAYLNEQDERRNHDEVRRHLESVAELQRAPVATDVPPPPVERDAVISAVADWTSALAAEVTAGAARQRTLALRNLRRELAEAESSVSLAEARIGDAARRLYADPIAAQRALADTSRTGVPLPAVAEMVQTTPALFGVTAESSASRFGPAAASAELSERATALAFAVAALHDAGSSLNALRDTAASALGLGSDTTAEDLVRTLDQQISTVHAAVDPHFSVARTADRMRALLAIADQKTRDAVLERVPGAAPIAREARALTVPKTLDRTL